MIPIKQVMRTNLPIISFSESVASALQALETARFDYLLIDEKDKIEQLVTLQDLLHYPSSRLVMDCGRQPVITVGEDVLLAEALQVLREKKTDVLVVSSHAGQPVGIVSQDMIMSYLYEELKKSSEALKVSRESFHNIIERSADGVVVVDSQGIVTFVNSTAVSIFGRKAEGLVGQLFGFAVVAGETAEVDIIRMDGQPGVAEMRTAETEWDGERACLISIRDITERKKMEILKNDFINNVSHELRTPLTTIREGVSQVLDGILGKTTKAQREFLSIVLSDADRLKRIIDDLLDTSRIESGKIGLNKELVDITDLARRLSSTFFPQAKDKGLEIRTNLPEKAIEVHVDEDNIIQVFANLVNNAIKFTKHGHVQISVLDRDASVECSVSDTGIGIAQENLPEVFSKFQQFGRTHGPGEKGTGLGLSIAKGIVESHKGTITVESKLNEGSTFTFTLPKLNVREVLRDSIEQKITIAEKNESRFSLMIVRLDNYAEIAKECGEEKAQEISLKIFEALQDTVIQGQVLKGVAKNDIVVLTDVGEQNGRDALSRLKGVVKQAIFELPQEIDINPLCGYSTYPDDVDSAGDLLEQAHKSLAREREERLKKSIMVVDDQQRTVRVLKRNLESLGYGNVTEANDGGEALDKIGTSIPDLIILDMKMPKMSGYEMIGRLKENVETKDIPILIMSGYPVETDKLKEYTKKKAIPVVGKPVSIDQLKSFVNHLL